MYRTEKAVLPTSRRAIWLILDDETLAVMPEARDFALHLVGAGKSVNTIRAYVPRITLFLNWAATQPGCDWKSVTVRELARFKWSLESPLGHPVGAARTDPEPAKLRSPKTVNAVLTAVYEFLRYGTRVGFVEQGVTKRLVEPRFMSHMPASFDAGERGQFRFVRVKELRARETVTPPATLSEAQVDSVIAAALHARDRFLLVLLNNTGIRIGEALGLRRSDMHFLPDSTNLGCEISGPHIHVIRREGNSNEALSKSLKNRHVPVSREVVLAYRDAQVERGTIPAASGSDFVFVNLWAGEIGAPMKYPAAFSLVCRVARRAGVDAARPHRFRHTAATRWIANGTAIDVAQELLGHMSPASTSVYTHASNDRLRSAVEQGSRAMEAGA